MRGNWGFTHHEAQVLPSFTLIKSQRSFPTQHGTTSSGKKWSRSRNAVGQRYVKSFLAPFLKRYVRVYSYLPYEIVKVGQLEP